MRQRKRQWVQTQIPCNNIEWHPPVNIPVADAASHHSLRRRQQPAAHHPQHTVAAREGVAAALGLVAGAAVDGEAFDAGLAAASPHQAARWVHRYTKALHRGAMDGAGGCSWAGRDMQALLPDSRLPRTAQPCSHARSALES